ncbi:MAG: NRDE family protein [Bacillaceae bacterium]|nr:NRDE family protein [Bacillaceae bacterium]
MCLILFSYHHQPGYRLIVAANRDEFYRRPTAPVSFWEDHPDILAGRDLEQKGTWMGMTRTGRFAALTNYRDPRLIRQNVESRGNLVSGFLIGQQRPETYLQQVKAKRHLYNGFNLLVGDPDNLYYYAWYSDRIEELKPGIHGISNAELNTPWPKVTRGKAKLEQCLAQPDWSVECLFDLLQDRQRAKDEDLPDTGVGLQKERMLSPIFITSSDYGTRSSTVLTIDEQNRVTMMERTYLPEKDDWRESSYVFHIQ